jgi:hypothetical protein
LEQLDIDHIVSVIEDLDANPISYWLYRKPAAMQPLNLTGKKNRKS